MAAAAVGGCGNLQAVKFCKVNDSQGACADLLSADAPAALRVFIHLPLSDC